MKIKIVKYDERRNEYLARVGSSDVRFDPFVGGILNGEKFDLKKITNLEDKELELDLFQSVGGTYLLTTQGENQILSLLESNHQ